MTKRSHIKFLGGFALLLAGPLHAEVSAWWNPSWAQRQPLTLDTSDVTEAPGTSTVLVRLFDGNFLFAGAREDGSDLRLILEPAVVAATAILGPRISSA